MSDTIYVVKEVASSQRLDQLMSVASKRIHTQATADQHIQELLKTRYMEKKYPYDCFVMSSFSNHDFLMPETQQPIIVIIYSPYFLNDLVEL